jgi:heme iron utilization protein
MNIQFDSVIHLLHAQTFGSLATHSLQMPGYPFVSVLPFVPDEHHQPVFLISRLAEHTKNLIADSRASLLVHDSDGESVLASERVSLSGDVTQIDASPELIARYLRFQPEAAQYLELGGFAFFRLVPQSARYVAGFGRMGWVDESGWLNAPALSLAEEAVIVSELAGVLPVNGKLLALDYYGYDIEQDGKRRRQRFLNRPVSADKLKETVSAFFA